MEISWKSISKELVHLLCMGKALENFNLMQNCLELNIFARFFPGASQQIKIFFTL